MNEKDRKLTNIVDQIAKQEYEENLRLIAECKDILLLQSIPENKKTPFLLLRVIGKHYDSTRRLVIHLIDEISEKGNNEGKAALSKDDIDKELSRLFTNPSGLWKERAAAVIDHAHQILENPIESKLPTSKPYNPASLPPILRKKIETRKKLDDLNFASHRDAVPFDVLELVTIGKTFNSSDRDLILAIMKLGEKEFLKKCNEFQFNKLLGLVSHFGRQKNEQFGSVVDVLNGKLDSLDSLKGNFANWFVENGYDIPMNPSDEVNIRVDSAKPDLKYDGGIEISAAEHGGRIEWKKNKTEFAQYVSDEFEKHPDLYSSLRDAVAQLFPKFIFKDETWTWEKCYDLARRV